MSKDSLNPPEIPDEVRRGSGVDTNSRSVGQTRESIKEQSKNLQDIHSNHKEVVRDRASLGHVPCFGSAVCPTSSED